MSHSVVECIHLKQDQFYFVKEFQSVSPATRKSLSTGTDDGSVILAEGQLFDHIIFGKHFQVRSLRCQEDTEPEQERTISV